MVLWKPEQRSDLVPFWLYLTFKNLSVAYVLIYILNLGAKGTHMIVQMHWMVLGMSIILRLPVFWSAKLCDHLIYRLMADP